MSKTCEMLKGIKEQIDAGIPPEQAIPYSIDCADLDAYLEVLYYAAQILPDGRRREEIRAKIKEMTDDVRRADG